MKRPSPPSVRRSRLPWVAVVIALAGALMGGVALGVVLTRSDPGACRSAAWNSLPAVDALPSGWTTSSSGIYIDSIGTTLTGPAPSASEETAPAIFVSVGCYGADAHLGVTRSHDAARSSGGADISFPSVGDESFATLDSTAGQYTVVFRRAQLLATLAAPGSVTLDDLATASKAVDDAMKAGTAGTAAAGPNAGAGSSASPLPSAEISPAGSPDASADADSHAAPDLEKQLPSSAAGVTLSRVSYLGTDVLGTDAASSALSAAVTALGRKPENLRIAEAFDPSGTKSWYVDAFELDGVSGTDLSRAVRTAWLGAGSAGVTSSSLTIGGKHVTRLDHGADVPADTVYVHGGLVFDIGTSDAAVIKAVLAKLP
jgi:hypothetical protein